jgi:hypothetical protein
MSISGIITAVCQTGDDPVKTSPGAKLAWRIASAEAGDTGYPEIEKGHLMIGILSLGSFSGHTLSRPENRASDPVFSEWKIIEQILARTGINVSAKTAIREELGLAGTDSRNGPVHRSKQVKSIFSRAGELSGDDTVTCPDLLAALVENPGPLIEKVLFSKSDARERIVKNLADSGRLIRATDTCSSDLMHEPYVLEAYRMLKTDQERLERENKVRFTDESLLHAVEYARIFDCETMFPQNAIDLLSTAAAMIKNTCPGSPMKEPGRRPGRKECISGTCEVTAESVLNASIARYRLPVQIEGYPDRTSLREEVLRLGNVLQMKKSLENDIISKSVTLRRSDISSGEILILKTGIIRDKLRIAELLLITQDIEGIISIFSELSTLLDKYRDTLSPAISQLRFMQSEGIDLDDPSVKELLLLLKMIADDLDISGSSRMEQPGG